MFTMPAGSYYIGDLCYVMENEWDDVCDLLFKNRNDSGCNEGKFKLLDGREFICFNTFYGDGTYFDGLYEFGVDSGSIGCIKVEDIKHEIPQDAVIIHFDKDFACLTEEGVMYFGHITIDTKGNQLDDDYAEDDHYDEN
jgi:hypothetical protein